MTDGWAGAPVWSRSVGWLAMALIEILAREDKQIETMLQELVAGAEPIAAKCGTKRRQAGT